MSTWIKAGFWQTLCPGCSGYKGWLNLTEFVKKLIGGGGTQNTIPKFGPDNTLVNSSISDTGTLVTVNSATRISGTPQLQSYFNQTGNFVSTQYISFLVQSPDDYVSYNATSSIVNWGTVVSNSGKALGTGTLTVNGGNFIARGTRDAVGNLTLNGVNGYAIKNSSTDLSNTGSLIGGSYNAGHQNNLNNSVVSSAAFGTSSVLIAQKGTITNTFGSNNQLILSTSASSSGTVGTHSGFYSISTIGRSDGTTVGILTTYYDAYFGGATVHPNSSITNRWGTYQANANHANYFAGNIIIGSNPVDTGDKLQVQGAIRTQNPVGGTSQPWKLGSVSATTPTSPNVTIEVEINGVTYYLHAKTTND